ncbi:MAG: 50S ribosomal protein L32 [Chlorobiota bacterium]|jgi:large subunit ribosomal protein L32|nr:50S ribosomal protein L32 [Chlorobiota bacterium]QQS67005.1 MAG: 50S ribosomal protein L32 [Chlorobiota bacterium]
MPNPKRRHSKSRRDKRRTHYKLTAPSFGKCPKCSEAKLNHTACRACGYYNGRVILSVTETT